VLYDSDVIDVNEGGQLKLCAEKATENLGNTTTSASAQVNL